jgi:hypothetical protein
MLGYPLVNSELKNGKFGKVKTIPPSTMIVVPVM